MFSSVYSIAVESAVATLVVLTTGCLLPSFDAARQLDAGPDPGTVAVGDFNGDGTFQVPLNLCGVSGVDSVAAADFDADTRPDLLVGTASGDLSVFLNASVPSALGLAIALKSDNAMLSLPSPPASSVLESTTTLVPPNWQPFLGTRATNNGRLEITVPLDPAQRYFRLRRP